MFYSSTQTIDLLVIKNHIMHVRIYYFEYNGFFFYIVYYYVFMFENKQSHIILLLLCLYRYY